MIRSITSVFLLAWAGSSPSDLAAQRQQVMVGLQPTNLSVDFSSTLWSMDPAAPNAFFAVLPLTELRPFMEWMPDVAMDSIYGPGAWTRCTLRATEWAYFSPDPCAHQPAPGSGLAGPQSLLTTTYDGGFVPGAVGQPHRPLLNWSLYPGGLTSSIDGSASGSWTREYWQLRTRGFYPTDFWNGCQSTSLEPSFAGLIAIRFHVTFT